MPLPLPLMVPAYYYCHYYYYYYYYYCCTCSTVTKGPGYTSDRPQILHCRGTSMATQATLPLRWLTGAIDWTARLEVWERGVWSVTKARPLLLTEPTWLATLSHTGDKEALTRHQRFLRHLTTSYWAALGHGAGLLTSSYRWRLLPNGLEHKLYPCGTGLWLFQSRNCIVDILTPFPWLFLVHIWTLTTNVWSFAVWPSRRDLPLGLYLNNISATSWRLTWTNASVV